MFFCPESPRWLARGDRFDEAEKILCNIRMMTPEDEYIRREMGEIREQVERRSTMRMSKQQQFKKLFQKGVRNRMGIGLALMFLQSFTGGEAFQYEMMRSKKANSSSSQHHHLLCSSHI